MECQTIAGSRTAIFIRQLKEPVGLSRINSFKSARPHTDDQQAYELISYFREVL